VTDNQVVNVAKLFLEAHRANGPECIAGSSAISGPVAILANLAVISFFHKEPEFVYRGS